MTTPMLKMLELLDWRGPSGRPMAHIVLTRAEAQSVLQSLGITLSETQKAPPYSPGDKP